MKNQYLEIEEIRPPKRSYGKTALLTFSTILLLLLACVLALAAIYFYEKNHKWLALSSAIGVVLDGLAGLGTFAYTIYDWQQQGKRIAEHEERIGFIVEPGDPVPVKSSQTISEIIKAPSNNTILTKDDYLSTVHIGTDSPGGPQHKSPVANYQAGRRNKKQQSFRSDLPITPLPPLPPAPSTIAVIDSEEGQSCCLVM